MMTKRQAIEKSLIHWLENQAVYEAWRRYRLDCTPMHHGANTRSDACALCETYWVVGAGCGSCPLDAAGYRCVSNGSDPYSEAWDALHNDATLSTTADRAAIARMVDVLASLLP